MCWWKIDQEAHFSCSGVCMLIASIYTCVVDFSGRYEGTKPLLPIISATILVKYSSQSNTFDRSSRGNDNYMHISTHTWCQYIKYMHIHTQCVYINYIIHAFVVFAAGCESGQLLLYVIDITLPQNSCLSTTFVSFSCILSPSRRKSTYPTKLRVMLISQNFISNFLQMCHIYICYN